jgi:hypothetical protein
MCMSTIRPSHERARERHRRSVAGKIIRAGRPAPSIRVLPTASPLSRRGPEMGPVWIDEAVNFFDTLPESPVRAPMIGIDPAGGGHALFERADNDTIQIIGDRQPKPFDRRVYEGRFAEQFPEHDETNRLIREAIDGWNRDALAAWEKMLPSLPTPPEGMAWFPTMEIKDQVDFDSLRAHITYRIKPELRDVPQAGAAS